MAFGQNLKQWRKSRGLTQQELAQAVGVNVSYISNLERNFSANTKSGRSRPSEALCRRISKVLGVSLDEVLIEAGFAPTKRVIIVPILADLDETEIEKVEQFAKFLISQRS